MPKSKEKSKKRPVKAVYERILDAALAVASGAPWQTISFYEIAEVSGVNYTELIAIFPTRESIVFALAKNIDDAVIAAYAATDDAPLRDRLFDIFMEKFDRINKHRAAFISMYRSFGWDKPSTCVQIKIMQESCTRLAGHVGMDVRGLGGRGQVTVLSLALVPVYWAWMRDETPDLAATMASLDKSLGHFEKIVNYLTPRAY